MTFKLKKGKDIVIELHDGTLLDINWLGSMLYVDHRETMYSDSLGALCVETEDAEIVDD